MERREEEEAEEEEKRERKGKNKKREGMTQSSSDGFISGISRDRPSTLQSLYPLSRFCMQTHPNQVRLNDDFDMSASCLSVCLSLCSSLSLSLQCPSIPFPSVRSKVLQHINAGPGWLHSSCPSPIFTHIHKNIHTSYLLHISLSFALSFYICLSLLYLFLCSISFGFPTTLFSFLIFLFILLRFRFPCFFLSFPSLTHCVLLPFSILNFISLFMSLVIPSLLHSSYHTLFASILPCLLFLLSKLGPGTLVIIIVNLKCAKRYSRPSIKYVTLEGEGGV